MSSFRNTSESPPPRIVPPHSDLYSLNELHDDKIENSTNHAAIESATSKKNPNASRFSDRKKKIFFTTIPYSIIPENKLVTRLSLRPARQGVVFSSKKPNSLLEEQKGLPRVSHTKASNLKSSFRGNAVHRPNYFYFHHQHKGCYAMDSVENYHESASVDKKISPHDYMEAGIQDDESFLKKKLTGRPISQSNSDDSISTYSKKFDMLSDCSLPRNSSDRDNIHGTAERQSKLMSRVSQWKPPVVAYYDAPTIEAVFLLDNFLLLPSIIQDTLREDAGSLKDLPLLLLRHMVEDIKIKGYISHRIACDAVELMRGARFFSSHSTKFLDDKLWLSPNSAATAPGKARKGNLNYVFSAHVQHKGSSRFGSLIPFHLPDSRREVNSIFLKHGKPYNLVNRNSNKLSSNNGYPQKKTIASQHLKLNEFFEKISPKKMDHNEGFGISHGNQPPKSLPKNLYKEYPAVISENILVRPAPLLEMISAVCPTLSKLTPRTIAPFKPVQSEKKSKSLASQEQTGVHGKEHQQFQLEHRNEDRKSFD